jgi:hypothetical protein
MNKPKDKTQPAVAVGRVSSIERNPTERSPRSPERVDVGLCCANPTYEAGPVDPAEAGRAGV